MSARSFAFVFGIGFLVAGIAGFFPPFLGEPNPHHPVPLIDAYFGQLLSLFPVNLIHNVVHGLFGVWGLIAARSLAGAIGYARSVAVIYALLTLAGFVPGPDTGFGLVPLYGNDIWLHGLIALIGAYFGWVHRNPVRTAP